MGSPLHGNDEQPPKRTVLPRGCQAHAQLEPDGRTGVTVLDPQSLRGQRLRGLICWPALTRADVNAVPGLVIAYR